MSYKTELPEYKHKLKFISEHAKKVDYDWFNKHDKIIWVNDIQYNKKYKVYRQGFLSMDRKGKFQFIFNIKEDYKELFVDLDKDENTLCFENDHGFDPTDLDWIFENISIYGLLWKINKIFDELTIKLNIYKSHFT